VTHRVYAHGHDVSNIPPTPSEASPQTDPSSVASYCGGRTRGLLRMASPLTLRNPGPDLSLTEIFCLVKLPHSRETIDGLVLSRQGGLDINPPSADKC
jgi:hypothetical protein